MNGKFLLIAIFCVANLTANCAILDDFFSAVSDLFTSDKGGGIELFEHIETMKLSENPENFLFFETDFENTGNPYLWVSTDKSDVGGGGYYFNIYKKKGEHYELLPDYAVFVPELLSFYGKDYSNSRPRLITYSRISGQEGNLLVYKIDENDKIFSMVYKAIEPMGADAEMFEKLFPEENNFVKAIPAADFVKFLESKGIKGPKKNNVEFLAFDLGGKTGVVLLVSNPNSKSGAAGWLAFNMYRKDTVLNDIGLGFVGVDLSLDNLVPFEVRNPAWKKLEIFPEGRKIIFFKNFSYMRKINRRNFLITLNRNGVDSISLSFYQLSKNRVCGFDIADIKISDSDIELKDGKKSDAFEFLKALSLDYEKDSKFFNYKLYPAKDVVSKNGEIAIPKNLDVDNKIRNIPEVTLPENNAYTKEFLSKWNFIRKDARLQQKSQKEQKPESTTKK